MKIFYKKDSYLNDIPEQYRDAHKHCTNNKSELEKSNICICFYCKKIFNSKEIENWVDEEDTALCPYCRIDSVIGDASGILFTQEFIDTMYYYWF